MGERHKQTCIPKGAVVGAVAMPSTSNFTRQPLGVTKSEFLKGWYEKDRETRFENWVELKRKQGIYASQLTARGGSTANLQQGKLTPGHFLADTQPASAAAAYPTLDTGRPRTSAGTASRNSARYRTTVPSLAPAASAPELQTTQGTTKSKRAQPRDRIDAIISKPPSEDDDLTTLQTRREFLAAELESVNRELYQCRLRLAEEQLIAKLVIPATAVDLTAIPEDEEVDELSREEQIMKRAATMCMIPPFVGEPYDPKMISTNAQAAQESGGILPPTLRLVAGRWRRVDEPPADKEYGQYEIPGENVCYLKVPGRKYPEGTTVPKPLAKLHDLPHTHAYPLFSKK